MERPDDVDRHGTFEGMAVSHVVGGLNASESRIFRSHLLDCRQCRARVGELRAIADDLADVERDERRTVERRRVDVKESEQEEEPEPPSAPRRPRTPLVAVLVLLVLVAGLASWIVLLRSQAARLSGQAERLREASVVLQLGSSVPVETEVFGVEVAARRHEGALALAVDGLDQAGSYHLYQLDGSEVVLDRRSQLRPDDGGRLVLLGPLQPGTRSVELRRNEEPTLRPEGRIVAEATLSP